ncbi:hypothetical protein BYT27DRAFT_6870526 [Phlegmacium glaucopus]|nr:hypothetical protein BYT27DRAFT_6870526 [Phlegmacium glaucopus]
MPRKADPSPPPIPKFWRPNSCWKRPKKQTQPPSSHQETQPKSHCSTQGYPRQQGFQQGKSRRESGHDKLR